MVNEQLQLLKQEERLSKQRVKESKHEESLKEKKGKKFSKALKRLSSKIPDKDILKNNKVTLRIKQNEPAPYVNRFFNSEINQAKKEMFFS